MMKLLSLTDIADKTGQTRTNVLYHARCGNLPATKVGGIWVVREEDARAFAQRYGREWHEGVQEKSP